MKAIIEHYTFGSFTCSCLFSLMLLSENTTWISIYYNVSTSCILAAKAKGPLLYRLQISRPNNTRNPGSSALCPELFVHRHSYSSRVRLKLVSSSSRASSPLVFVLRPWCLQTMPRNLRFADQGIEAASGTTHARSEPVCMC